MHGGQRHSSGGEKIKACETGQITVAEFKSFVDSAQRRDKEISDSMRAYQAARGMLGRLPTDSGSLPGQPYMPGPSMADSTALKCKR